MKRRPPERSSVCRHFLPTALCGPSASPPVRPSDRPPVRPSDRPTVRPSDRFVASLPARTVSWSVVALRANWSSRPQLRDGKYGRAPARIRDVYRRSKVVRGTHSLHTMQAEYHLPSSRAARRRQALKPPVLRNIHAGVYSTPTPSTRAPALSSPPGTGWCELSLIKPAQSQSRCILKYCTGPLGLLINKSIGGDLLYLT